MERAAHVGRKRDIMNLVRDGGQVLHLAPLARALAVLEDEHLGASSVRVGGAGRLLGARRQQLRQVGRRRRPADAGAGAAHVELVLQRPGAQVHHVHGLVDADDAVGRDGGQLEAHVARREAHVRDRGARVDQRRAPDPRVLVVVAGGVTDNLLPDGGGTVERARGQHLTELGVCPGHLPDGARVRPPTARALPLSELVLVPDLDRVVAGTGGQSAAVKVERDIVDEVVMARLDVTLFEAAHDARSDWTNRDWPTTGTCRSGNGVRWGHT